MKIEFNPDGSIKLPSTIGGVLPEHKDTTIIIERHQKNTQDPAIAQIFIKIPKKITLPFNINDFFKEKKSRFNISAIAHELVKIDNENYIITIQGVLPMYKWAEYFINQLITQIKSLGYGVQVKGTWEKYESPQIIIQPTNRISK